MRPARNRVQPHASQPARDRRNDVLGLLVGEAARLASHNCLSIGRIENGESVRPAQGRPSQQLVKGDPPPDARCSGSAARISKDHDCLMGAGARSTKSRGGTHRARSP